MKKGTKDGFKAVGAGCIGGGVGAGNLALLISLIDSKDSTIPDFIGITLWNGNELWFSSNWTGTETNEQPLDTGNLVVRN
jgi:hypothetical protein